MSGIPAELHELNQRRRRAVQLRVDGLSLARIREATGLSVPTIIRACQAFTAGGWAAINVGARGRPRGDGRALDPTQEQDLRQQVLRSAPEAHGLGPVLWDATLLQALARQRHGVVLETRALSRLLERWGLALHSLRQCAGRQAVGSAWLNAHWTPALSQARLSGERLLWAGALQHSDRPAPAGLLVAQTPRGSLQWLAVDKLASEAAYLNFLGRLVDQLGGPWRVFLHGPDLSRARSVTTWLSGQARLQVLPCPVAPAPRRAPEAGLPVPAQTDATDDHEPTPCVEPADRASDGEPDTSLAPNQRSGAPARVSLSSSSPQPETDPPMSLTHLQRLEAESIHIMREVVAEADNPVMLYSIGKDSAVMLHLARKAFYPAPPPFPLLHVDTTWKFRAMYEMRDRMAKEIGMDLLVHHNPEAQELGINPFEHGSQIHTDMWKTQGLKQALDKYNFDVAFGGARRDEEKSRAKERIFSFRSAQHRWDPKNQRPELWRLYNGRKQKGESIRCFPISNWTELDVWQYIYKENIPIVPLYMAAERPVVERDGTLIMVDDDRFPLRDGEVPMMRSVRFRTLGCYPLSGAVESTAATLPDIIQEMLLTKTSERQGRMIDHDSAASMEKKKQEGYF